MPQTTLSVVLRSRRRAWPPFGNDRADQARRRGVAPRGHGAVQPLKWVVPTLHFMSMSVFQDSHYDPS